VGASPRSGDVPDGSPPSAESAESARGPDRVLGVLLCGGSSRRMGTDKARVELRGRPLIAYPLEALRAVAATVVLATGSEPRYPELGLDCCLDPVSGGGPLAGLVAGLATARERGFPWVACLACDMPRARSELLRELLTLAAREDLDACLLHTAGGAEPLYAAYRTTCLEPAQRALGAGERRVVAFHGVRSEGRALRVGALPCDGPAAGWEGLEPARNLNTPAEWLRERNTAAGVFDRKTIESRGWRG